MSIICDFHRATERLPELPISWGERGKVIGHHSYPCLVKLARGGWAVASYARFVDAEYGSWSEELSGVRLSSVVSWAELPHD